MSITRKKHFSLTLVAVLGAVLISEFVFVHGAGAETAASTSAFESVEIVVGNEVYMVKVRKDPPAFTASTSAYFY